MSNNPIISSQLIDDKFTKELREYLRERLPEYMMPLYYIPLEKLPLTINGKLDKNALPNLEFDAVSPYVHPKNEVEHKLCKIYSDVLGLPEEIIGISDEFYKLGGNSLLAIRLTSKINDELNLQISLADFLSQQTIESLSNYISIIKENSNSEVLDEGTI